MTRVCKFSALFNCMSTTTQWFLYHTMVVGNWNKS